MNNNEENILIEDFLVWYWAHKDKIQKDKKFWNKNKFGRRLSKILKECNRWKSAPRGKHDKGKLNPKKSSPLDDEWQDFSPLDS